MTEFKIPAANWSDELAAAIRKAQPGDTVIVRTEPMRKLGEIAAGRMGKTGIDIVIARTCSMTDPTVPSAILAGIKQRHEWASDHYAEAAQLRESLADIPALAAGYEALLKLADDWEAKSAEIWAQIQIQDCDAASAGYKAIGATRYREDAKTVRETIRAALTGTGKEGSEDG